MKKVFAVLLVTLMVFSFIACDFPAYAAQEKVPTIAFAVFDYSNAFMAYIRKGIENYTKGKANFISVDAANDQARQNEQVQTLIQRGVDALIINLVDPGAGQTLLDAAKAANIPVCFINRAPDIEILKTWDKCWYVGIDWMSPGLVQADLIKADWEANKAAMDKNGDGVLQYVLVQGNISQQDGIYRTRAIHETFAKWNEDGTMKNEQLDIQEAGWNTTRAKELMETWIIKYGNRIEAVVCNNDAMAMGVIEALRGHGYFDDESKKVYVYGINAIPQVWPLIENGELSGTILTSPWLQAIAAADICIDSINGREPLAGTDFVWSGESNREIRVMDYAINSGNLKDAEDAYNRCN